MKNILVFSHNYLFEDKWKDIVIEQLDTLINFGLYEFAKEIYYGVYSDDLNNYFEFINILNSKGVLNKINIIKFSKNYSEYNTLLLLQQICKYYDDENCVVYYHTKGVSSHKNFDNVRIDLDCVRSWRKMLEYFNLERWKDCYSKLYSFDTCGALYQDEQSNQYYKHFYAGNFWWANVNYIKKLPNVTDFMVDNIEFKKRLNAEMWIGMIQHSWANLYTQPWTEIYQTYFDPKNYRVH